MVGTVDEDFAVESQRGDVFLLGNTSWRIMNVRGGDVNVVDAGGAPPTIPFWFGEAPGRTLELSAQVSLCLRDDLSARVIDPVGTETWLVEETSCTPAAAQQTVLYVTTRAVIGLLPTQRQVVFERFFDESGGMQLVIHAPFGGRITRAWGMAMRKRFCRSFDFELQATADDDGIILSLGPQHSFPLESMFAMLNPQNVQPARAGGAGKSHVPDSLALECDPGLAGDATFRRQEGSAPAAAISLGRSPDCRVSEVDGLQRGNHR